MTVPALSAEAQPPAWSGTVKIGHAAKRWHLAFGGEKNPGVSVGGGTAYPPPPRPPRSTPTAAVRGEPYAPAPSLRQGAHMPDAQRRAQRKGPAPKCTCNPRARLCRAAAVSTNEQGSAAAEPFHLARPGDPSLSQPLRWDPRTTFSRSGTALLASRCPASAGGRATKVTAPGPLPISPIPLPAPKCPLKVSEGGKR